MRVIASEEIVLGRDLPILCNYRDVEEAAVVGVDDGVFAKLFLSRWRGRMLSLIDPYVPHSDIPGDRSADLMVAVQALATHHGRFKFYMIGSVEAARVLPDRVSPRFVYIDSLHNYDSVRMDIDAWWNRLPDDGILAGSSYGVACPGVIQAVNEFSEVNKVVVRLTTGDMERRMSWYAYKTEPEKLYHRNCTVSEVNNKERGR